jgi:FkbM family methyltransferase
MTGILVRKFSAPEKMFNVTHVPFLARFYCHAFHSRPRGKMGIWSKRLLRKTFRIYRKMCGPAMGEFEYVVRGQGSKIRFNARNLEFHALYNPAYAKGYEIEVAALLQALLPEGGTMYDVGSNWGYHTMVAAGTHAKLTVHAFEPTPETFKDLAGCIEQAGLSGMVTCHNFALSSADGKAFMTMPDGLHSGFAEVSREGGMAGIEIRRLDSLNLPKPDFIKMDVEGHEIEVLKGAQETLKSARPYLIFESRPNFENPKKVLEVFYFLSGLGYRFFAPAIQKKAGEGDFILPMGWLPTDESDNLALMPFTVATRLLGQVEFNVFACHEERLTDLTKVFKACP